MKARIGRMAGVLGALVTFGGAAAQAPALPPAAPAAAPYVPSMSDMMNIGVIPRHAKIGVAVKARNWTYLAYEVRELRGAFTRITRTIPLYEGRQDTAALMAVVKDPLDELEAAIKARDAKRADAAYAGVTAACNACHLSVGRAYIAIMEPKASMFPSQDFRPPAN